MKAKNGWQVAIDIFYTGLFDENKNVVCSPFYDTEEQADKWYRNLDFTQTDFADNLDVIMLHWVDGEIEDSYII